MGEPAAWPPAPGTPAGGGGSVVNLGSPQGPMLLNNVPLQGMPAVLGVVGAGATGMAAPGAIVPSGLVSPHGTMSAASSSAGLAMSRLGMGGAVPATPVAAGAIAMAGFFRCSKCDLDKPMSKLKMCGNQKVCIDDVNNYQALATRWKQQRALKQWWKDLPAPQKVEWYRKEQKHCAGQKRNFDNVAFIEQASVSHVQSRRGILNHIPLNLFIRNSFMEGIARPQAIMLFNQIVLEHRANCVYENGEWHVPDYGGISSQWGQDANNGYVLSRGQNNIQDAATVQALLDAAQRNIASSSSASSRSMQLMIPDAVADYPTINRNPADVTAPPSAPSVLRDAITAEVLLRSQNFSTYGPKAD